MGPVWGWNARNKGEATRPNSSKVVVRLIRRQRRGQRLPVARAKNPPTQRQKNNDRQQREIQHGIASVSHTTSNQDHEKCSQSQQQHREIGGQPAGGPVSQAPGQAEEPFGRLSVTLIDAAFVNLDPEKIGRVPKSAGKSRWPKSPHPDRHPFIHVALQEFGHHW